MNVAILNFSPNVGKTIIAKNLLMPRLPFKYISLESIYYNPDIHESDIKIDIEDFFQLQLTLSREHNILVDIGSSELENFFKQLEEYDEGYEDYDYFIVPITPNKSSLFGSLKTLKELIRIGVDSKKIRFVFNKMQSTEDLSFHIEFADEITIADAFGIPRPSIGITFNSIYSEVTANHLNLQQVMDYFKTNETKNKNFHFTKQSVLHACGNLDLVFRDMSLK